MRSPLMIVIADGFKDQSTLPSSHPDHASVSRRFAVEQLSGGRVKLRPIDDLSESLINATASRTEAVTPHGIDTVCRALVFRLKHRESCGLPNDTVVKATDLRKAYKQLALAPSALDDPNIAVADPCSGNVHIFRSTVLPFGSAASVPAFCRASHAVWKAFQHRICST